MRSLTEVQRKELAKFGFDDALFTSWQNGLAAGTLTKSGNLITAPMLAPDPGSIAEPPSRETPEYATFKQKGVDAIRRGEFGIVVLNGGMATRFGGVVKGVVDVLGPGRSFLGLKLEDVRRAETAYGGRIPVFLMNSFATDAATKEHLEKNKRFGMRPDQTRSFTQFVSVRLDRSGDVFLRDDGSISPYGPGHGDFAAALRASGCLKAFLDGGGKYLFLANVDNLGARISPVLLGMHVASGDDVTVEVAPKWPGDVGGSPYLVDGKLQLVEQIRYPAGFDPEIVDVFNTNTFTFTAAALNRDFDLAYYYVEKKVDGRTAVQFERLVGELTRFLPTQFVKVKRSGRDNRFFPIKTPEDLEAGREDIAELYPRE